MAFLGNLAPAEAATLLEEHTRQLQEQIDSLRATIERGVHLGVDRLFLVEDEYTLALLQAKLTFVQQLIREIKDETLTETSDRQLIWKIRRPDLSLLSSEEGRI